MSAWAWMGARTENISMRNIGHMDNDIHIYLAVRRRKSDEYGAHSTVSGERQVDLTLARRSGRRTAGVRSIRSMDADIKPVSYVFH